MATRYSWVLTSLGTPTLMDHSSTWAVNLIMPRSTEHRLDTEGIPHGNQRHQCATTSA